MLGGGFKAERLRVNLRLVINRLKLLEKKKSKSIHKRTPWSYTPTAAIPKVWAAKVLQVGRERSFTINK